MESGICPFVKWAGGKRQLLSEIRKRIPPHYRNYYEPFVGGGAVLFELLPENAFINDLNEALVNTYRQIKTDTDTFLDIIHKLDFEMCEEGKPFYYAQRALYNAKLQKGEYDIELAALFVFLNKHCFNGLYRVNSKGFFNVPYNNLRRLSCDEISIRKTAEYLERVSITVGDFEKACVSAGEGDFVFFDSPYVPLSPSSFEAYTKEGFSQESHERLARLFDELTVRGCYCMLTNHNTELIRELYGGKGYTIEVLDVKRMINRNAANRKGQEVIIRNY